MGARPGFPPSVVVAITALACELPSRRGLPLARWSVAELRQEAVASGIVARICQIASKADPLLECAPSSGQDQAAVLTVCRAC